MTTAGVVLAAGAGRRFGGPKAPVLVEGERLVDRAVRVLRAAGCAPVVVVLGAWVGAVPGADVVINTEWATGMGSSLRAGLAALRPRREVHRVVVTLVDLPGLTPAAVGRLIGSDADLCAAAYDGQRRHPVLLGRRHWPGVASVATGDAGAREYLDQHGDELLLVEVGDVATGDDLDHPPWRGA